MFTPTEGIQQLSSEETHVNFLGEVPYETLAFALEVLSPDVWLGVLAESGRHWE
jgi:hypothetical protein